MMASADTERAGNERNPDLPDEFRADLAKIAPFTMVRVARSFGLWSAVNYVCAAGIEGDFVECGVWRGGQSMLAALAFQRNGEQRDLHLYDTFAGMTEPGERDVRDDVEADARTRWRARQREDHNSWAYAPLPQVRRNMASTGYPDARIRYHVGPVEETLLEALPERIAILRLDTDWYESTRIEMEMLFPRIAPRGVLLIDDYGVWKGSRAAVDEYLRDKGIHLLLARLDVTGRIAIVP